MEHLLMSESKEMLKTKQNKNPKLIEGCQRTQETIKGTPSGQFEEKIIILNYNIKYKYLSIHADIKKILNI